MVPLPRPRNSSPAFGSGRLSPSKKPWSGSSAPHLMAASRLRFAQYLRPRTSALNLLRNSRPKKKDCVPSPPKRNSSCAPKIKNFESLSIYLHFVRRIHRTKKLPGGLHRSNQKENNDAIHDDGKAPRRQKFWPTTQGIDGCNGPYHSGSSQEWHHGHNRRTCPNRAEPSCSPFRRKNFRHRWPLHRSQGGCRRLRNHEL